MAFLVAVFINALASWAFGQEATGIREADSPRGPILITEETQPVFVAQDLRTGAPESEQRFVCQGDGGQDEQCRNAWPLLVAKSGACVAGSGVAPRDLTVGQVYTERSGVVAICVFKGRPLHVNPALLGQGSLTQLLTPRACQGQVAIGGAKFALVTAAGDEVDPCAPSPQGTGTSSATPALTPTITPTTPIEGPATPTIHPTTPTVVPTTPTVAPTTPTIIPGTPRLPSIGGDQSRRR